MKFAAGLLFGGNNFRSRGHEMSAGISEQVQLGAKTSIETSIGGTPLIQLRRSAAGLPGGVQIFAKAEHLNPGGSVKDRPALWMILDGERSGALLRGMTILDA